MEQFGDFLFFMPAAVAVLALLSVYQIFARPDVFMIPIWLKTISVINFIIDMTGGIFVMIYASGYEMSVSFYHLGVCMVFTSMFVILIIFNYIHGFRIPGSTNADR